VIGHQEQHMWVVFSHNFIIIIILLLLLLFGFTVSSTEGLTATCAAAFELSYPTKLELKT